MYVFFNNWQRECLFVHIENKFTEISKNLARSENNFVELLKLLCKTLERNERNVEKMLIF